MKKSADSLGFVLLELMVALFTAAAILVAIVIQYSQYSRAQQSNANSLLHVAFAIAYSQYIDNNSTTILASSSSTSPYVISYAQLVAAGYINSTNTVSLNPSGFYPCAIILSDGYNLYPLIVDVSSSTSATASPNVYDQQFAIGSYAGVYGSSSISSYAGWSIAATSPYLSSTTVAQCLSGSTATVVQNSIVTYLALAPFYSQQLDQDISLHRTSDIVANNQLNKNILKTNISLANITSAGGYQYNSLVFNSGSKFMSYTKTGFNANSESAPNNNVLAQSFVPVNTITPGFGCNANIIGQIVASTQSYVIESATYGGSYSNSGDLVCEYNPVMCTLMTGSTATLVPYCYLPTKKTTINYNFSNGTTTSFKCPKNVPIAIDAHTYAQQYQATYTYNGTSLGAIIVPVSEALADGLLTSSTIAGTVSGQSVSYTANTGAASKIGTFYANNTLNCTNVCGAFHYTVSASSSSSCTCTVSSGNKVIINTFSYVTPVNTSYQSHQYFYQNNTLANVTCTNKTIIGP